MTTVAAIATAEGAGGIAVVRISGTEALPVLKRVFSRRGEFVPNMMYYGHVRDTEGIIDEAMAVYMRAPRSYTCEDVVEIQCHGGDISARRVLRAVLKAGAVAAEPGEFTRRAFMNGRIDLSQAEAVMQLISARSEAAARASVRQLTGGASAVIRPIMDELYSVMALIEASDDFPDEIDENASSADALLRINGAIQRLDSVCDERSAHLIMDGASVVLAGRPNVGKSSVMNALAGAERAIVTDVPGTTRDVLTARISINGISVELSDTAGLRDTHDTVEKIGVDRARQAVRYADMVIVVIDAGRGVDDEDDILIRESGARCLVCVNKTDLSEKVDTEFISERYNVDTVAVSALTGEGMDDMKDIIARHMGHNDSSLVTQRHIESARAASEALREAANALESGFPLDTCAVDISRAMEYLGAITGENVRESVIDRVFRDFCVGK